MFALIEIPEDKKIWINTTEGVEITGYNHDHVRKLARDNWNLPEEERVIRIRRRSNRYDIWLPDLLEYVNRVGYGPQRKRK